MIFASFRPRRLLILASLGLLLCPALLAAQQPVEPLQSVIGTVRDTAGKVVGGADVLLGARKTTTSPSGVFRVDSLKPGKYGITIRMVGFKPVHSRVVVVPTEPTEMEYFLVVAPYLLDPIEVASPRIGIYGAVGDTSYKAAVGARVEVRGFMGGETLTDSMGRFAFPNAEQGAYMVRVTYPGYTERRFMVEVKRGEGQELGVLLARASRQPSRIDEVAVAELGQRLAAGLAKERMTASELERHESQGLCDVPRIRIEMGGRHSGATTTLVLNGVTVINDYDVASLCHWRADEVDLVEFGTDPCKDVTGTIVEILNAGRSFGPPIWCFGRTRDVPRSFNEGGRPLYGLSGSYVIIWEKR